MALNPTASTSRPVDPILEDFVAGLANASESFIAERVAPGISSEFSGTIITSALANFFGDIDHGLKRAPKSGYQQDAGPSLSNTTYRCQEYGLEVALDRRDLERANEPLDLQRMALDKIGQTMLLAREARLASVLGTGGNWTYSATLADGSRWDDNRNPFLDMEPAVASVEGFGKRCNVCVIGRQAARTLSTNAQLLAQMPDNVHDGFLPRGDIAALIQAKLGVEAVYFGFTRKNSASEGQTASLADVYGDWVWFGHVNSRGAGAGSDVMVESTALANFQEFGMTAEEYDRPEVDGLVLRLRESHVYKVIHAQMGALISTTQG